MGLLDKLWDDTVAGPTPDTGLGRLRKVPPISIRTDFSKDVAVGDGNGRASREESAAVETTPRVTRSIMIRRPAGSQTGNGTPPESPAGSTTPVSPFFGSPGGRTEWNRFRRKSMSDAYGRSGGSGVGSVPTTPGGATAAGAAETGGVGSRNHYSPFEV